MICPDKDQEMYHYQVCFADTEDNEFTLLSYVGYTTYEGAKEAWEKEWLEVINLARDPEQYRDPYDPAQINEAGKISLVEHYKNPESKACNEASFLAVISEKRKTSTEEQGLIDYYTQLADLFPIYKTEVAENQDDDDEKVKEIEEGTDTYKYRVVVRNTAVINSGFKPNRDNPFQGTLLWESVACFDSLQETIDAYQHFYTLAGTPNNCRVLCEKGRFYVGLIEVFAESFCDFESESEAWDDAFPDNKDACGSCVPRGVRAFVYAAEEDKNYIPVRDQEFWKFKVVASSYFVADHNCWYNSETNRDEQKNQWQGILRGLDWNTYMSGLFFENEAVFNGRYFSIYYVKINCIK